MALNRRELLRVAATGAAAMLGGRLVRAQSGRPIVLGTGSHRFLCRHDWLAPPPGMAFGDTHGLAQDKSGRIYLAHTVHASSQSKDAVCVYSPDGSFLTSWGARFAGGAHGLDIREESGIEYLYHCDTKARVVVKSTLDGKTVWERGAPVESGKYSAGEPFVPTNVAFSPSGGLWVADGYGSHWIHKYDRDGNYIKTFGGEGTDPGRVRQPHGLWLDDRWPEPLLAVADRGNRRIQYFDMAGKHVRMATEGMRLPCDFDVRDGTMLVPDLQSVITLLDERNSVIVQLGDGDPTNLRDRPRSEFIQGKFIHPHDAIFLRNGDILVAEWVPVGRVTLLSRV